MKNSLEIFTNQQIAKTLEKQEIQKLKVFAYAAIDENNVLTVKIFANEENGLKFIEEMNLGTIREAFNNAFMKGYSYKKVD